MAAKLTPLYVKIEQDPSNKTTLTTLQKDVDKISFKEVKFHPRDALGRFTKDVQRLGRDIDTVATQAGKSFKNAFDGSFFDRLSARIKSFFSSIKSSASSLFSGLGGGGGGGGGGFLGNLLSTAGGTIVGGLATGGIGAIVSAATSGVKALGGALLDVVTEGIDFNATLESAQIALKHLLGSSQAAKEQIELLKKEALAAPVKFENLLELDQRLIQVGFSAKTTAHDLTNFAQGLGLIAGTKGLDDRMGRIVLQLTQMATKGKAAGEELTVLAENGIPAYQLLAQALGKSVDEVRKLSEQGRLKGLESAQLILLEIAKKGQSAASEIQNSFSVLSSNLDDLKQQASGEATKNLFTGVERVLQTVTGEGSQKLITSIAKVGNTLTEPLLKAVNAGLNIFDNSKILETAGNFIEGLNVGIEKKLPEFYKKVEGIGSEALSTLRKVLGIESPSKRMEEIGELSGEGYKIGLLSKKGEIQAALAEIIDIDALIAGAQSKFGKALGSKQADNLRDLLKTVLKDSALNSKDQDVGIKQLAYILATIKHETGNTFAAVTEKRANAEKQPELAARQNKYFSTGFQGRGLVQITHEDNYRRLGERLGIGDALVKNPELALRPDIAAQIALIGSEEGLFTGKSLDKYINGSKTDYVNARRVINGTDRAGKIAGEANDFLSILRASVKGGGGAGSAAATATTTSAAAAVAEPERVLKDTVPIVSQITADLGKLPYTIDTIGSSADLLPVNFEKIKAAVEAASKATDELSKRQAEIASHALQSPITQQIKDIQGQIDLLGKDIEDKIVLGQLQGIYEIKKADDDAIISMAKNRELLADKTIFHAERAKARVVDYLEQESKGVTQIVSDAQIGGIRTAFDLADKGIDRITVRLGIFGNVVKQVLSDLAHLALSKFFTQALGLGGAPGAGPQAAAAGGGGGGGAVGAVASILTGGGGGTGGGTVGGLRIPGLPGGTTPPFAGGSIPGLGGGGNGLVGGLLKKIPGLGGLFGGINTSASAATQRLAALDYLPGGGDTGAGVSSIASAATGPGLLSSLGAGGLLAGGGIAGSFLGGSSPIGKLLGGLGGTLGAGAIGATGIFGGGLAAALPALFSNPITAIVAGGLIGGALLFNLLGNQDFKKFQKAVQGGFGVKVKNDKAGQDVFGQIKTLGQASFGKGFASHFDEIIHSERGKETIANYAIATGQFNSSLAKEFINRSELTNLGDARNQFVSRSNGGLVPGPDAGRDTVPAILRGGEGVLRPEVIQREGVGAFQSLQNGNASIVPNNQGGGRPAVLDAALVGVLNRVADALGGLETADASSFFKKIDPAHVAQKVVDAFDQATGSSLTLQRRITPNA
jgi:tape measure domain-containing protein